MKNFFLAALAISVLFFLVRFPYFFQPFDGQDGNGQHSLLFLRETHRNDMYLNTGKFGDARTFEGPRHPGFLYEIPLYYGKLIRTFESFENKAPGRIVAELKFWFSLPQLFFWLLCLYSFWLWRKNRFIVIIFLSLLFSKIAVVTASEVQPDSYYGFPICGIFALILGYPGFRNRSNFFRGLVFFIGSFFIGLGKSEWTVCYVVTSLVMMGFLGFQKFRKTSPEYTLLPFLGISLAGLAVANVVSYWISPYNFRESWNLVALMVTSHSANTLSLYDFIRLSGGRSKWFCQIVAVLAFGTLSWRALLQPKNENLLFLYLLSGCYFSAYFLSAWGDFARYFAPSFAFAVPLLIYGLVEFSPKRSVKYALAIYLVFFGIIKTSSSSTRAFINNNWNWTEAPPRQDCVPVIRAEHILAFPNHDFVHSFVGDESARILAKNNGKVACESNEEKVAEEATQVRR